MKKWILNELLPLLLFLIFGIGVYKSVIVVWDLLSLVLEDNPSELQIIVKSNVEELQNITGYKVTTNENVDCAWFDVTYTAKNTDSKTIENYCVYSGEFILKSSVKYVE